MVGQEIDMDDKEKFLQEREQLLKRCISAEEHLKAIQSELRKIPGYEREIQNVEAENAILQGQVKKLNQDITVKNEQIDSLLRKWEQSDLGPLMQEQNERIKSLTQKENRAQKLEFELQDLLDRFAHKYQKVLDLSGSIEEIRGAITPLNKEVEHIQSVLQHYPKLQEETISMIRDGLQNLRSQFEAQIEEIKTKISDVPGDSVDIGDLNELKERFGELKEHLEQLDLNFQESATSQRFASEKVEWLSGGIKEIQEGIQKLKAHRNEQEKRNERQRDDLLHAREETKKYQTDLSRFQEEIKRLHDEMKRFQESHRKEQTAGQTRLEAVLQELRNRPSAEPSGPPPEILENLRQSQEEKIDELQSRLEKIAKLQAETNQKFETRTEQVMKIQTERHEAVESEIEKTRELQKETNEQSLERFKDLLTGIRGDSQSEIQSLKEEILNLKKTLESRPAAPEPAPVQPSPVPEPQQPPPPQQETVPQDETLRLQVTPPVETPAPEPPRAEPVPPIPNQAEETPSVSQSTAETPASPEPTAETPAASQPATETPAKTSYSVMPPPTEQISEEIGQKEVLLAETNLTTLGLLYDVLTKRNFVVSEATEGWQVLDLARTGIPRLIIMDVTISNPNCLEVCTQLAENSITSKIPIIMLAAHSASTRELKKNLKRLTVSFLQKPFSVKDLISKVESLL